MRHRATPGRRTSIRSNARPASAVPGSRFSRRLVWLLGGLGVVILALVLTGHWRDRLLRESAHYRSLVAEAERASDSQRALGLAAARLEEELRHRPDDLQVRLQLAELRWLRQGPQAAILLLRGAPRPWSDPALARMLAHCSRLIGREDHALAVLNEGIRLFPRDGDLRADRAMLYVLLAWQRVAEKELKAGELLGADDIALVRAALARAKGDLVSARQLLQTALAARPGDAEIARQLAAVAADAGEHQEAIRLLLMLDRGVQSAEDRLSLASAYLARSAPGSASRALEVLDRALILQPGHARVRFLRARCLRMLGRTLEATPELEAVRREFPRMYGLAHELAEQYRQAGRLQEARRLFEEHRAAHRQRSDLRRAADVLMRDPGNASAHLEVGRLCLDRGMYGRAIVELERALHLDPRLAAARRPLNRARIEADRVPSVPE